MKNYCDRLGLLAALTILLGAAPCVAVEGEINQIKLKKDSHHLEVKLSAETKDKLPGSFYTLRKGNTIEANLINTDLKLPNGIPYQEHDPIQGIDEIKINQFEQEHTQITVSLAENADIEHLFQEQNGELVLSLNRLSKAQSLKQEIKNFGSQTIDNIKQTYKSALQQSRNKESKNSLNRKARKDIDRGFGELSAKKEKLETGLSAQDVELDQDVLVPNPEIVIDDNRVSQLNDRVFKAQDSSTASPTLPRAVAPPVGDMAVSNINTMPDMVDLGSNALVPRLVLRDAPIREVLSLLARSANLNVVYSGGKQDGPDDAENGPTISLDLENQPVQEVFNSVLLVSGLDANRRGNIIYVGEQLPASARNLVSRTIRLNQVVAENAALYLASQGATGKRLTTEVEEIIDEETGRVVQRKETSPELRNLDGGSEDESGTKALMLKGLQVSSDDRLNSITLVGEPRKVEVATALLTQLDARRRQVAVNVKVLDVNLLNQDLFNSSFSFGVDDNFFSQDGGSAVLNFGETRPPNNAEVTASQQLPPVSTLNTFAEGVQPFFDIQDAPFGAPAQGVNEFANTLSPYARPSFGTNGNPFQPGVSDVDIDNEGRVTYEYSLPSLFQYPDKFLAQLNAQVTSGNAKILTDPTLMVQEGQQATVKLAQNIVESVRTDIDADSGTRTITPVIAEAGVVLTVNVERIDDNGFVSMSVSPTVSSIGATQNFDSGGGAVNLLNLLSKRELSSGLVRLRDGQTLILSGIIQDQERTTISKVPVLGDIPLLGSLFRSTDKASERAEVIVLLTPEIVEEDAGLASNFSPSKASRDVLNREGVGLLNN